MKMNPGEAQTQSGTELNSSKQLIIHCDDLGMAHSINAAAFSAFETGAITSGSVMVPCPWFSEVVECARRHPEWDIGVHVTLTSEWNSYRWAPITSHDKVGSLLDPDGYFVSDTKRLVRSALPDHVELEIRSQVERALSSGLKPSHLDSHMFAVFKDPRFTERFARVAYEYELPFLLPPAYQKASDTAPLRQRPRVESKTLFNLMPPIANDQWLTWYISAVRQTAPGINQLIVHLGNADSELRAITNGHTNWDAAWRQRDLESITSQEFAKAIAENDVRLISWLAV